jgi:hypothetical protein
MLILFNGWFKWRGHLMIEASKIRQNNNIALHTDHQDKTLHKKMKKKMYILKVEHFGHQNGQLSSPLKLNNN